jgi:hypothetical protein
MDPPPVYLLWRNAVSILSRLIANRHLDDAALAEIWTVSTACGDPASNPHLDGCAACRGRYDEFRAWLDALRDDADAEADAVFTNDRLAAQQAQILRRLEATERPARVIAFPRFSQPRVLGPSIAHRWVTIAAAAGLVIGVALGQWLDLRHRFGAPTTLTNETVASPAAADEPEFVIQTTRTISDEALLSELEASLSMHPSVEPLRAIDTITPRSRDILDQAR